MVEPTYISAPEERLGRRMVVNMTLTSEQMCLVRSCEVKDKSYRNRTTFGEHATIDYVFCPAIAQALHESIHSLQNKTEVLALPSFLVEIPGLTLMGLHLIVTKLQDSSLNIIARFSSFIGGINSAFASNIGFTDHASKDSARLAAEVLHDIALPLLDICSFAETEMGDGDQKLGKFGARLNKQSHLLRFKVDLLKRFVAQEMVGVLPSDTHHPQLGSTAPRLVQ